MNTVEIFKNGSPIIVTIKNVTDNRQKVKIFSPDGLQSDNYGNTSGIIIKSNYDDISYEQALEYLRGKTIQVGLVVLSSNDAKNVTQCYHTHTEHMASGTYSGKRFYSMIDPYQQVNNMAFCKSEFALNNQDDNVSCLFVHLMPNSELTINLYPKQTVVGPTFTTGKSSKKK